MQYVHLKSITYWPHQSLRVLFWKEYDVYKAVKNIGNAQSEIDSLKIEQVTINELVEMIKDLLLNLEERQQNYVIYYSNK